MTAAAASAARHAAIRLPGGLRGERDRFMAFAFCWADALLELDRDGRITYAAGAIERLIGHRAGDVVGRPVASILAPELRDTLLPTLDDELTRRRASGLPVRFIDARGEARPLRLYGYRLDELAGRYFLALRTGGLPAEASPPSLPPRRDAETGMLDAASFVDVVRQHLAAGVPEEQAVTLLGVRNYEQLIEALPAAARQRVLAAIAAGLDGNGVEPRVAGRLARDRFAVVHGHDTDTAGLIGCLEQVLRDLDPDGGEHVIAGTIALPQGRLADDQLVDGLVYAINRFRTASGADFSLRDLTDRMGTLADTAVSSIRTLSAVVRAARFDLVFQPIVNTRTGEIHHYETLFRFPACLGISSPFEQICLAEHTGLITELDLAVTDKAIAWMRSNTAINGRTRIAVNLSGRSINDTAFLERLGAKLADNAWTAGRLLFEITESCRVQDLDTANAFIRDMRERGYEICLDDFGVGASNFQYLSKFDIDYVKLDGSAVHNAFRAQKGKAFLSSIVHLCKQLGVATVAEMIETEALFRLVRDCGVQYVQGYLFGRPCGDIKAFKDGDIRAQVAGVAGPITRRGG